MHGHDIAEQGPVRIVRQQAPLLVCSHTEDRSLLVKLYLPRLLREAPCRVSTTTDAHPSRKLRNIAVEFLGIADSYGSRNIILLVVYAGSSVSRDPYYRNVLLALKFVLCFKDTAREGQERPVAQMHIQSLGVKVDIYRPRIFVRKG